METNEDWIREIVKWHLTAEEFSYIGRALVDELATEVTSRLAEAYEQGRELGREGGLADGREAGFYDAGAARDE